MEEINPRDVSFEYYPHRGISRATYEIYDIKTKLVKGEPLETGFYYPSVNGFKFRRHGSDVPKSKRFYTSEGMVNPGLFGKDKFDPGSKDAIVICEGMYDGPSVYEMLQGKVAGVNVSSSGQALRDIIQDREYVNSFNKIYLCFDNDEPGHDATRQVATSGIFDYNKLYIIRYHKHKDPNEYLESGDMSEFVQTFKHARRYTPDNIISTFSEIEKSLDESGEEQLATYPFERLNNALFGMHEEEIIVWKGMEGIGKQLPNITPMLTPKGWTTLGELKVGDTIFGVDGKPTTVIFITETQYNIPCYNVIFADGTSQIAGGPHKWGVFNSSNQRYSVKTTEEILKTGVRRGNTSKYSIPLNQPINFPTKELPIDPYLLGVWLGDGHSSSANITVGFSDIGEFIRQISSRGFSISYIVRDRTAYTVKIDGLTYKQLRLAELLNNKHIPKEYLLSSVRQRRELLKGLMDTDGSVTGVGCEFYNSNFRLMTDFLELGRSLGFKIRQRVKQGRLYGVAKKLAYTAWFLTTDKNLVFSYQRKLDKVVECKTVRATTKTIREIIPVESMPSRCLQVDNDSHLFVCGKEFTVTHNTEVFRAIEHHILKSCQHKIGIIHLEESTGTTVKAIAGYELEIPATLPDCGLSKQDILNGYRKAVSDDEGRVHIYCSFETEDENAFYDHVRFLGAVVGCKIIFLDHITWMGTGLESDDERRKLDRISQKLKLLAKELKICIHEISHINDDGKTRGSRNISKVANTVILLERNLVSGDEIDRNCTYVTVEKARLGGRTGSVGKFYLDPVTRKLHEFDTFFREKEIPVVEELR